MRNTTPYYLGNIYHYSETIENADGTNLKELLTAPDGGLRIGLGTATNDDTNAYLIQMWKGPDAASAVPVYSSLVNAEAGFKSDGTEPAYALFNDTDTPAYPQDNNGNYYMDLAGGEKLFVKVTTAVTAAKAVYISVTAYDFEAE